jgi:hypothetical protein
VIRGRDPKVSGGQVCHNEMRRESGRCDGRKREMEWRTDGNERKKW